MTKKARFINKLNVLSSAEKENLIAFFTKNPVFENHIDWNNRSLKRENFDPVIELSMTSRKNRRNTIKMFNDYKCKIIFHTKELIIVVPLDWYCAKFFNSFNCGGESARWCIGNNHSNSHWNHYMAQGNVFYFLYFFRHHPVFGKKLMVKIDSKGTASFYTQKDRQHSFDLLANFLRDRICGKNE